MPGDKRVGAETLRLVRNVTDYWRTLDETQRRAAGPGQELGGHGDPIVGTTVTEDPPRAVCDNGADCFSAEAIDNSRAAGAALYRLVRRHHDDVGHAIHVEAVRRTVREFTG
jgi:hypothetical protein